MQPTPEVFTFADTIAIAGIGEPTGRLWFQNKMFRASVFHGRDHGRMLAFSFSDVFACWLVGDLRRRGVPLPVLKKLVDALYETPLSRDTAIAVIVDGEVKLMSRTAAANLTRRGVVALVIDVLANALKLRADIDGQRAQAQAKAQAAIAETN